MANEGIPFKGILYIGLMLTKTGPKVLEYNCRFGDPETQVVIPRLKTDLIDIVDAVINNNLSNIKIEWKDETAVCVVMSSGGYPGVYEKGKIINGINEAESLDTVVFHAGTELYNNKIVTASGRVLGVTALGEDIRDARKKVYEAVSKIHFDSAYYRKDIGL
jgi:phosphoribosylamine--glycine ligase